MSFPIPAPPHSEAAHDHISSHQTLDAATGPFRLAGHFSVLPTEGRRGDWYECALPITVRERIIIAVTATLKDKSNWERKVFDERIVKRWRIEALTASQVLQAQDGTTNTATAVDEQTPQSEVRDATSHYNAPARQRVVTEKLFQYCIDELRDQAAASLRNKFTEVMEANAAVYISDRVVSLETKLALQSGVAPLEDVPDILKDWHPGSDGKVLDIVHPSLYPLMYGKSKCHPVGTVPLQDCSAYTGQGNTVPIATPPDEAFDYSTKHQWLPCEVLIGTGDEAKITSYINNLHPDGNEALYAAIEQVISRAIPLWKATVRSTLYRYERPRLIVEGDGYDHEAAELVVEEQRKRWQDIRARMEAQSKDRASDTILGHASEAAHVNEPGDDANDGTNDEEPNNDALNNDNDDMSDDDGSDDGNDEDDDDYDSDEGGYGEECYKRKYIQVPEPSPYEPRMRTATDEDATGFRETFTGNKLQVIVKLANIHLTPEKPTYDGGSWHIEGLPNEHICASALYYYDSSNVTESHLAFRESVNQNFLSLNKYSDYIFPPGPEYEQNRYNGLIEIYGLADEASGVLSAQQVLGKVSTREGRLLVFPNVLQHRVLPFKLADATKPGHRKLLALFLVDPNIKVPSTANIPPQQRQWWTRKIDQIEALSRLPPELKEIVYKDVDFPLSVEQAKRVREELMEERRAQHDACLESWQNNDYSFCEH